MGSRLDPLEFHESTKHSPISVRAGGHLLDWANRPHPFKDYLDLTPTELPRTFDDTGFPAALAIAEQSADRRRAWDLGELARLLVLGAGVLRERRYADGERFYFRTYASAGALYPIELYVACSGIDGLEVGLYHFHPLEFALRRIRSIDPRPYLARATGGRGSVARAPVTIVLSGIPWRTTWKYQARGYRHLYWDSGMIVANLLALTASGGHAAEVVLGFVDAEVDALLGIDSTSEMSLAVIPLAFTPDERNERIETRPPVDSLEVIEHRVRPLSAREHGYPELEQVQGATAIEDPKDAATWQRDGRAPGPPVSPGPCPDGLEKVIRKRGSSRAFTHDPILAEALTAVFEGALHRLSADWGPPLIEVAVLLQAVEGLAPGAYRYGSGHLEVLAEGEFRDVGHFLCLEQPLGGDAAVTSFLLSDVRAATREIGPRAYRAAQLEAGITAGRLYLGAYACGVGATGLTFYDDKVREFFKTPAEPMLVVALGRPAKGRRLL